MKIKRMTAFVLCGTILMALVFGVFGCNVTNSNVDPTEAPDAVIVSKYLLKNDPAGTGNNALNICLYSNGKMTVSCIKEDNPLLSYMYIGKWTEDGDVLTIVSDDDDLTVHFSFDKGKKNLSFIAEGSDTFSGYHLSDGDIFYLALKFAE